MAAVGLLLVLIHVLEISKKNEDEDENKDEHHRGIMRCVPRNQTGWKPVPLRLTFFISGLILTFPFGGGVSNMKPLSQTYTAGSTGEKDATLIRVAMAGKHPDAKAGWTMEAIEWRGDRWVVLTSRGPIVSAAEDGERPL